MQLLQLPPEILIIVYESFTDVRALYNLTQTCTRAQELYTQNCCSIIESVAFNIYSDLAPLVLDTLSAICSLGELDYAYLVDHCPEWIVPEAYRISRQDADRGLTLLKVLTDFVLSTEDLADWCTPKCRQRTSWHCEEDTPFRRPVLEALLHIQLITNRLYNVRLPSFPEHVSLREHERDGSSTAISRKTRDQALDLMADQLRPLDIHRLRNTWILMQILQDEYLLLRRHRLRPMLGSVLDLLFQHDSDDHGWRISPWFVVQGLLSSMGVHVVSARPGTAHRFLGHEPAHELQQRDIVDFDRFVSSGADPSRVQGLAKECPICLACDTEVKLCPHDYLERFRPVLGLSSQDMTPVKLLVRFAGPLQPIIVPSCYRLPGGETNIDHLPLGKMLSECAEHNRTIKAAKRKNSSRASA